MKTDTLSGRQTPTIERHEENLMGLPVILLNAAVRGEHGDAAGIVVPDVIALEAAMAVARVTVSTKLSGKEIRFLRRALGIKAIDLAKFLDITPETFSRWENGAIPISTNAERILRLRIIHALRENAPGVPAKDEDILNMSFSPVRSSTEPTTLIFERARVLNDGRSREVWCYSGTVKPVAKTLLRSA